MKTVIIILIALSLEVIANPEVCNNNRVYPIFTLGIEAGTNYNILKVSDAQFEIENNLGYNIGVNFVYLLGDDYDTGILFSLDYLNRNHSFTNILDNISGEISYNTLQFRANYLMDIYFFNDFILSALGGPVFGYLYDSRASNESGILLENNQSFEMLLNFGFKFEKFFPGATFGIEYNYQLGLTNMNTNYNRLGNNTHNLMLTYRVYFFD